jgi:hypothetical protein
MAQCGISRLIQMRGGPIKKGKDSGGFARIARFIEREQGLGVELIHGLRALMERKACKLRMPL